MTPRHLARPITCCLLLLFLGVDIVCAAASGRKPNVILVMTDDQGYGDLSCHGNPVLETPHLDALHRESIRLTDFHSAPMCTATRGQLLTGCDALHNGATHVSCGRLFVRRGIPTMADIFSATGYQTGHFGKWHLGGNYPYRPQDRGFQETVGFRAFGLTAAPNYWNSDYFDDHYLHNGKTEQYPGYCTDVWFNEAMEWIEEQHKTDKPFFAYLATNAPHLPFWVPDRYRKSYRDQDPDVASFFAMLANIDENMGRLRLMLQKTGLAENTILIYLTDNGTVGGQSVFNAGMRGNKAWLYEGGHRVPCFIHWPAGGLRDPGDVDALTECQDLLPTLLDLCGVAPPANTRFDGVSLAPLLHGTPQQSLRERMLVVQYGRVGPGPPQRGDATVMWNRWRLFRTQALYDLTTDPGQTTDVAQQYPHIVRKLKTHYDQWWSRVAPGIERLSAIGVGADAENPLRLTCVDWPEAHCDTMWEIRRGPNKNSPWNLEVQENGRYLISLRRWPAETEAAITAAMPAYRGVDGSYTAGRALPITRARIQIGDQSLSQAVTTTDKAVHFIVDLKKGRTRLKTWFDDVAGNTLCGAFYVDIERKSPNENKTLTATRISNYTRTEPMY